MLILEINPPKSKKHTYSDEKLKELVSDLFNSKKPTESRIRSAQNLDLYSELTNLTLSIYAPSNAYRTDIKSPLSLTPFLPPAKKTNNNDCLTDFIQTLQTKTLELLETKIFDINSEQSIYTHPISLWILSSLIKNSFSNKTHTEEQIKEQKKSAKKRLNRIQKHLPEPFKTHIQNAIDEAINQDLNIKYNFQNNTIKALNLNSEFKDLFNTDPDLLAYKKHSADVFLDDESYLQTEKNLRLSIREKFYQSHIKRKLNQYKINQLTLLIRFYNATKYPEKKQLFKDLLRKGLFEIHYRNAATQLLPPQDRPEPVKITGRQLLAALDTHEISPPKKSTDDEYETKADEPEQDKAPPQSFSSFAEAMIATGEEDSPDTPSALDQIRATAAAQKLARKAKQKNKDKPQRPGLAPSVRNAWGAETPTIPGQMGSQEERPPHTPVTKNKRSTRRSDPGLTSSPSTPSIPTLKQQTHKRHASSPALFGGRTSRVIPQNQFKNVRAALVYGKPLKPAWGTPPKTDQSNNTPNFGAASAATPYREVTSSNQWHFPHEPAGPPPG